MLLRPAVPNESELLSALALRSKAYWGYSEEFMAACKDELTYPPETIADSRFNFTVAAREASIIGFYAVERYAPGRFELEALFVAPEEIGTGCGRRLLQHALATLSNSGGGTMVIQSDPNAESFYLAAGAVRTGVRASASVLGRDLPLLTITA